MFSTDDHLHMARALRLAARAQNTTHPNPRVGCVLVRDGEIVGEGWHERVGEAHAETNALAVAGPRARGATAYVTLEPCAHHGRTPPCADALIEAGLARVVAAMRDPNPKVAGQGLARLEGAGIETAAGLMEVQARALNPGYLSGIERGRPWLRLKLAVSLDGRTALASGESKWITGAAARADVHRLRARSDLILTGIGTVLADDPQLSVRTGIEWPYLQPARMVVDSHLRCPVQARLFRGDAPCTVAFVSAPAEREAALLAAGARLLPAAADGERVGLEALLADLARDGVREVLAECGPGLAGGLLAAGVVDELVVYQAASVLGASARGMFALPGPARMQDRAEFELVDRRCLGDDLRFTYRPAGPGGG